jgi:hypothetical protein
LRGFSRRGWGIKGVYRGGEVEGAVKRKEARGTLLVQLQFFLIIN